jgi:hypothetical protein
MVNDLEHRMLKNKRYRLVEHMKKIPRRQYLMTIRYNNETYQEMRDFTEVASNAKRGIKCVYGCPKIVSDCVIRDSVLMVLEMNNDENRIEGIGMVRNTVQEPFMISGGSEGRRTFQIHNDGNLNRFVYIGAKRIDRNEMTEEEEQVFAAFDIICFKGKLIDLQEFAYTMFKNRYNKKT